MTPLHVRLVSQWYPPEPVLQPAWIAQALTRLGADVDVLTGIPNYPSGRVADGYRALSTRRESMEGLDVQRTPLYPNHGSSSLKRIANYLSWAISGSVLGNRRRNRPDVALVYSSPATAALPAMVGKWRFGVPYVLLIQDVWPDSVFAAGHLTGGVRGLVHRALSAFVDRTYRSAAAIVVISPGMADLLVSRGVPRDKVQVIYNWVPEGVAAEDRLASWRAELGIGADEFVLLYAGNHGSAQALGAVVEAFDLLRDEPAHLVLVGDGVEKDKLQDLVAARGLPNVHMLPPRPRVELEPLVAGADAHLVSLADEPLYAITIPSKLQAGLAAGKPVVVSVPGDAAAIAARSGGGIGVAPESPAALAEAVRELDKQPRENLSAMGARGRAFYESHMSEQVGAQALLDVLQGAARTHVR